MDLERQLTLALELVDRADTITMSRFRADDLQVATKPDLTPVSEADQAVEQVVRDRLAAVTDHSVVGEEFDDTLVSGAEFRWIIDPIDGTKNYVRGVPIWATMLGLEHAGHRATTDRMQQLRDTKARIRVKAGARPTDVQIDRLERRAAGFVAYVVPGEDSHQQ